MMASVTRWFDNKSTDIDSVLKIMSSPEKQSEDGRGRISFQDLVTRKVLDENETIELKGKKITFNLVRYTYNQVSVDDSENPLPIEDRTVPRSGSVIVYTDGMRVRYIINRNSDAQRVLRFILGYSGKGEVIKNQPILKSDMFIWLIKKIYSEENAIDLEDGSPALSVDNLTEFRGQTEDATNMVSANGDTIMNILSTLSFLLESNLMKQIKFNVEYDNHSNIELVLSKSVIGTSVKNYSGAFEDKSYTSLIKEDNDLIIEAKIYLVCYLIILPEIIQTYEGAIDADEWNSDKHKEFLKNVASDLQKKINHRVENIDK